MAKNSFVVEVTCKRQPHKMVKHTQTIQLFECVWPFCGVGAWRVNYLSRETGISSGHFQFNPSTSNFVNMEAVLWAGTQGRAFWLILFGCLRKRDVCVPTLWSTSNPNSSAKARPKCEEDVKSHFNKVSWFDLASFAPDSKIKKEKYLQFSLANDSLNLPS